MTKTAKDLLARLQMKYGNGERAPWREVATEELHLPASYVSRKDYREQLAGDLGLHQLVSSQKAPWFVKLEKLAEYMDKRGRMVA